MKKEENLEKQVKELEKSNRWMKGILLALTGIFFIGLCVGFGYILGNNNNNDNEEIENKEDKDKEEKENDEEEIEVLSVESKVVKDLFEVFKEESCFEVDIFKNLNDSRDAKMYLVYRELNESEFTEMRCGDLNDSYVDGYYCASNEEAFEYYGSNEVKFQQAIANEKIKVVKASLVEKKYKEIFGKNANYTDETFKILDGTIPYFAYYDSKNDVYAEFSCNCGGMCGEEFEHTLDSIEQRGKILKLNTTLVNGEVISSIVYTFEYEKETGNYIFVSREEKE